MTLDVRFRVLDRWPAASTPWDKRRGRHTFRTHWNDTLALLEKELGYLDATDVVIEAALRADDIRADGWPRANAAEPSHPGVIVSFGSKHGPLRYLTDAHGWWRHNVHAIALGLGALRAVDRYGITHRAEQYQGWAQIGTGNNGAVNGQVMAFTSTASAEAKLVNLLRQKGPALDDLAALDARALYRKALTVAHPDHGGSRELLEMVQAAGRAMGVA